MFKRRAALAGPSEIPLHSLRHSWATAALRAGENPKIVSQQLGHASAAYGSTRSSRCPASAMTSRSMPPLPWTRITVSPRRARRNVSTGLPCW